MTPQVPQHIQIEMARRELRMLIEQRSIAEQGIEMLSGVSAEIAQPKAPWVNPETKAIMSAVVALVHLRLLELQHSHSNLVPRIAELEGALKIADGGIVIPGMRVKS